ncbi:BTB/POZ protein [Rhizophagus clarus]|uniref:BTB/POZ protein n=1 Tax=Rhizophagus clarus TaxID=94130 RepID=A0A8H3QLN6_9GLOM|nr:BTB/POZ protein [Rhizophagus clarus]
MILFKFCVNLIYENPDRLFTSINFSSIPEKLLVSIIQNGNLQMSDIQIWNRVLEMEHCANPGLSTDPSNPSSYSSDDF